MMITVAEYYPLFLTIKGIPIHLLGDRTCPPPFSNIMVQATFYFVDSN